MAPGSGEVWSSKLLESFQEWLEAGEPAVPRDNTQLFSGEDFDGDLTGLATFGSMCDKARSSAVISLTNSRTVNGAVVAHEMCHNLGFNHDGGEFNDCPEVGFVMNGCATFGGCGCCACARVYVCGRRRKGGRRERSPMVPFFS